MQNTYTPINSNKKKNPSNQISHKTSTFVKTNKIQSNLQKNEYLNENNKLLQNNFDLNLNGKDLNTNL